MAKISDIRKDRVEKIVQGSTDGVLKCDVQGNFQGDLDGNATGNAGVVTNGMYTVGNQAISGVKEFSSTITGNITGNAGTVTNGVYTTGNQTIGGIKNFTSQPVVVGKYIYSRVQYFYVTGLFSVGMGVGSGTRDAGEILGAYTPYSSTSKVMALFTMNYSMQQIGGDNDARVYVYTYSVQSTGVAISHLNGGASDNFLGYLNSTVGAGSFFGQCSSYGVASRGSDGKCRVQAKLGWSDGTSGFSQYFYNYGQSVTFIEMY
jgi:hypothetical protein